MAFAAGALFGALIMVSAWAYWYSTLRTKGKTIKVRKERILAIRDALAVDDYNEAYHQLYSSVCWDQRHHDPFQPWKLVE